MKLSFGFALFCVNFAFSLLKKKKRVRYSRFHFLQYLNCPAEGAHAICSPTRPPKVF